MTHRILQKKIRSTSSVNPYQAGTEFNIVNIMAADALAPWVARTSAPMILTM